MNGASIVARLGRLPIRPPAVRPGHGNLAQVMSRSENGPAGLTIGIDARAATEVEAGRGRVVRELLRALGDRADAHRYVCYARRRWDEPLDDRFRLEAHLGGRSALARAGGSGCKSRVRRLPVH